MVTFLNLVRTTPDNSFAFLAAARAIRLGSTPSRAAATCMANELLAAYARVKLWPDVVRETVTASEMLARLDCGGLLSIRPALVAHVAGLIRTAHTSYALDVLDNAVEEAVDKLRSESLYDFVIALGHLYDEVQMKVALHALASSNASVLASIKLQKKQLDMLRLLCEATEQKAPLSMLQLLPPYAVLTKECLNDRGDLLFRWHDQRWSLGDRLMRLLIFFAEENRHKAFSYEEKAAVSTAVLRVMVANGIGVKRGAHTRLRAADVLHIPQLAALLTNAKNVMDIRAHQERLVQGGGSYGHLGLHVLRWIRNVAAHSALPESVFEGASLPPAIVDAAVQAAVHEMVRVGRGKWALGDHGVPVSTDSTLPSSSGSSTI